ncbi:MAG TPA: DUF1826 domain-containing protein, partial [Polyangiaceae bacterium]
SIHEPRVSVAIWERQLPPVVERKLASWGARAPLAFDALLDSASYDISRAVRDVDEELRAWLVDDMALLVEHFLSLAEVSRFRLHFGAVPTDQCRKFHVDYFRLRMVTTYAGPGTEWLPETAVNRAELEPSPELAHEANRRIVKSFDAVRQAGAGDVVLLKGAYFGSGSSHAAVHRSPPIERQGATRVVLVTTAYRSDS